MSLLRPHAARPSYAAAARSVLSCPATVEVVLDGRGDLEPGSAPTALTDLDGRPALTCPDGSPLAVAGHRREVARLRLTATRRLPGGATVVDRLDLVGRLAPRGVETAACCPEGHRLVVLHPSGVLVSLGGRTLPVPVGEFLSPALALNPGYLQRAAQHAEACHAEELRHAAARHAGVPVERLLAASLADLGPEGVELRWVDGAGAHARRLAFGRPARDPADLGALLSARLAG